MKTLRYSREAKGLSLSKASKDLGMSISKLRSYELGENDNPSLKDLIKLANYYEIEPIFLVKGKDYKCVIAIKNFNLN